jgi:hypothetical protein
MNLLFAEELDQGWVFEASDAVSDASWLQEAQRFPNALGAASFAGMGGAVQLMLSGIFECGNVGGERIAGFVTGYVDGCDIRSSEAMGKVRGLETLFAGEVAECAEDDPGLDAGVVDLRSGLVVHDLDDFFGGESSGEMK